MLQLPNGRIKMSASEEATYREFSGLTAIPSTKADFTQTLLNAASTMRDRLKSGDVQPKDNIIRAEMIEDYLASPHEADVLKRHRDWRAAGCPIGEEALRQAGLSSPALDRLERERNAGEGEESFSQVQGDRLPPQIGPNESGSLCQDGLPLNLKPGVTSWITVQSALAQADIFDDWEARHE